MTSHFQEHREGSSFQLAFEESLPAMNALREDELLRPNADVPTIVTRLLGALPRLRSLRAEMAKKLPEQDPALVDNLETFTLALAHAHALTLAASGRPSGDLATLNAEGTALREGLLADARNLARHRLVDAGSLEDIKGLVGYRNVAFELLALATLLRRGWPTIAGKTPLSLDQLDRAELVSQQLIGLIAAREHKGESASGVTRLRQRAFTLFFRTYSETKRAVIYLRWYEDDAEDFCPSLFTGRRNKHPEQEEPDEAPAAPVAPAAPETPGLPVGLGMPGSNPFQG